MSIRNRIKEHVRVRAGDLVAHEGNFRKHPKDQRAALQGLYNEVGFARSVLAYRLGDGRLKLIDGHLRAEMDPEMILDVEVLDVTDDEAKKLLLSMDPLAALATTDHDILDGLRDSISTENDALAELWANIDQSAKDLEEAMETAKKAGAEEKPQIAERFLVLIETGSDAEQRQVWEHCKQQGWKAKTLTS